MSFFFLIISLFFVFFVVVILCYFVIINFYKNYVIISILFNYFFFMKITVIFSCSGMFQDVPACSGMFHVPGFIDALSYNHMWSSRVVAYRKQKTKEYIYIKFLAQKVVAVA